MTIQNIPALPTGQAGAHDIGAATAEASRLTDLHQSQARPEELREVFDQFVGETFYNQMLKAMRQTVDKPAYLHGGRAEEVFQNQLDQLLSERMSQATAQSFTGPMFELFQLPRS